MGTFSNESKSSLIGLPNSFSMIAIARSPPKPGTLSCRSLSTSMYSFSTTSVRVEMTWPNLTKVGPRRKRPSRMNSAAAVFAALTSASVPFVLPALTTLSPHWIGKPHTLHRTLRRRRLATRGPASLHRIAVGIVGARCLAKDLERQHLADHLGHVALILLADLRLVDFTLAANKLLAASSISLRRPTTALARARSGRLIFSSSLPCSSTPPLAPSPKPPVMQPSPMQIQPRRTVPPWWHRSCPKRPCRQGTAAVRTAERGVMPVAEGAERGRGNERCSNHELLHR